MPSLLLAALALAPVQGAIPASEETRVEPPVGTSGGLQSLALEVRRASRTDLARATRLAGLLPRRDPAIFWDDRNVPAVSRAAFAQARDYALAEWGRMLSDFQPKVVKSRALATRGLVFSFEPRLANGAGATHFLDRDTTGPRLETVIGLRRGENYSSEIDLHNEVLYAIGTYLGVVPNPSFGGALGRTDLHAGVATSPRSSEARIAEESLVYAAGLRRAIAGRKPLDARSPKLWVETKGLDLGVGLQGKNVDASFTVANNGTGPMLLSVQGNCTCLTAVGPTRLEPGESGVVRAHYDTSVIGGSIAKRVLIRTTDPDQADVAVPLRIQVRILARFIAPEGSTLAPTDGAPIELFFVMDESKPLEIRSARVDGIEGTLTYEPWKGTLADPSLGEGNLARTGYRLRFVPKSIRVGAALASFAVSTSDGEEHVGNLFIQRGIVATPPSAGFNDPGTTLNRAEIKLTRLERPFRIVSIRAEGKGVSAVTASKASAIGHSLVITLDPARLIPKESRRIVVRTDDPAQPEIVIPLVLPEE